MNIKIAKLDDIRQIPRNRRRFLARDAYGFGFVNSDNGNLVETIGAIVWDA